MSERRVKPFITYFHTASWPINFGVTFDPDAFEKEQRRLGVKFGNTVAFCVSGSAQTTAIGGDHQNVVIVTINLSGKHTKIQRMGLVAHEATHVWQEVCSAMNGTNPGGEHEAYGIQYITHCILSEME